VMVWFTIFGSLQKHNF